MYAGHFAAALALKSLRPETPTWALATGTGALDIVFGVLVATGVEGFAADPAAHLLIIPWSHSLLGACAIGAAFAAAFWPLGMRVMATLFAAVISHWLLDVLVHRPDMSLWPNAAQTFGFYSVFGPVSGWAESVIVVAGTALYVVRARRARARSWIAMCGVMGALWVMGLASG